MNEKKDFYKKHREDIIETIQLRAKERRVLISLILLFFVVLAYENSASLTSMLWDENFSIPELGNRPEVSFTADMIERFDRPIAEAKQAFPQYWAHFAAISKHIEVLKSASKNDPDVNLHLIGLVQLVKEFLQHPGVDNGKKNTVLEKEINQIVRVLKLPVHLSQPLKEISFNRFTSEKSSDKTRNLFEYSQE